MVGIALYDHEPLELVNYESKINYALSSKSFNFQLYKFTSIETLVSHQENNPYKFQIIILNLLQSKKSVIQAAIKMKKINQDLFLIFLSDNYDYLYESFNIGVSQFLLLPKDELKIYKSLEHLYKKIFSKEDGSNFVYKTNNIFLSTPNSSIVYFEIYHRIIHLHRLNQKPFKFYLSLKELEDMISKDSFIKVYRSYIVNMKYIEKITSRGIELKTGEFIPVSRNLYENVVVSYANYLNKVA